MSQKPQAGNTSVHEGEEVFQQIDLSPYVLEHLQRVSGIWSPDLAQVLHEFLLRFVLLFEGLWRGVRPSLQISDLRAIGSVVEDLDHYQPWWGLPGAIAISPDLSPDENAACVEKAKSWDDATRYVVICQVKSAMSAAAKRGATTSPNTAIHDDQFLIEEFERILASD